MLENYRSIVKIMRDQINEMLVEYLANDSN